MLLLTSYFLLLVPHGVLNTPTTVLRGDQSVSRTGVSRICDLKKIKFKRSFIFNLI